MKFKHVLIYASAVSFFLASCSKNQGIDTTGQAYTTPPTPVADVSGTTTVTPPSGVTVGTDAPPISGDNSNMLMGNPSGAGSIASDNYLLNQGYYVESYNATKQEPNWVCWHLDASSVGATGRTDAFAGFAGLPSGMFQVQSDSYDYATFGFDRGHNCPSADRTSSTDANKATFLMTNMIPQAPNNNQQTWGNFEDYCRSLLSAGNEIYIIMGSYGTGGTGLKGTFSNITLAKYPTEKINVPSNVWKVAVVLPVGNGDLARVSATTRVISINTPNVNSINSNWKNYITTLGSIEAATSYTLLSALPQSVHDALKNKVDPGQ
jgi:endonuclease G